MNAQSTLIHARQAGLVIDRRGDRVRIDGPGDLAEQCRAIMDVRDAIYDELEIEEVGCFHHDAESPLGKLARNLLKWRRGEMVQTSERKTGYRVNVAGMANQMLERIAAHTPGEPPREDLRLNVEIFKAVIAMYSWRWQAKDYDFPEDSVVVDKTFGAREPAKPIARSAQAGQVHRRPFSRRGMNVK